MVKKSNKQIEKRGASSQGASFSSRLKMFFHLHRLEIKNSFNGMVKTPLATLMTLAVLGSLPLP